MSVHLWGDVPAGEHVDKRSKCLGSGFGVADGDVDYDYGRIRYNAVQAHHKLQIHISTARNNKFIFSTPTIRSMLSPKS